MRANILSNRREVAPRGIEGGGDARPGVNQVIRADGTVETLSATASAEMREGDMFVIETPGGGGFGPPRHSGESRNPMNTTLFENARVHGSRVKPGMTRMTR